MGELILDTARWQALTGVPAEAFDAANAPAVARTASSAASGTALVPQLFDNRWAAAHLPLKAAPSVVGALM